MYVVTLYDVFELNAHFARIYKFKFVYSPKREVTSIASPDHSCTDCLYRLFCMVDIYIIIVMLSVAINHYLI